MKAISTILTIGIFAFFLTGLSYADETQDKTEALQHAEEAIKHGKMGHAKV